MLTKAEINFIKSLQNKQQRDKHKLFVAQGPKVVNELLNTSCKLHSLFATKDYHNIYNKRITLLSEKELERICTLKNTRECVAIFNIPDYTEAESKLTLVLDGIQDPGNLGTIIRIADWYNIKQIICSPDCADCYNSKAVQASMASIGRVNILYTSLIHYLGNCNKPIYGAVLSGNSIYQIKPSLPCVLAIGSEGKGLSPEILNFINYTVTIPKKGNAESLNAAVAAAIICDRLLGE